MARTASAPPQAATCTVIRSGAGVLRVRWSADPGTWRVILEDFKGSVGYRPGVTFDGDGKCWVVPPAYADLLTGWMGRYFPPGAVVWEGVYPGGGADRAGGQDSHARRPAPAPALASSYKVLYLAPGAPAELVEAARRVLSKRYHPDAGGDTATMQRINAAADLLLAAAHTG